MNPANPANGTAPSAAPVYAITPDGVHEVKEPVYPCWMWDIACNHWSLRPSLGFSMTRLDLHNERLTHWCATKPDKAPDCDKVQQLMPLEKVQEFVTMIEKAKSDVSSIKGQIGEPGQPNAKAMEDAKRCSLIMDGPAPNPPEIPDGSPHNEGYPSDWKRIVLMVSPSGEMHAVGGEREPGEGDMPFPGLERIKKRLAPASHPVVPDNSARPETPPTLGGDEAMRPKTFMPDGFEADPQSTSGMPTPSVQSDPAPKAQPPGTCCDDDGVDMTEALNKLHAANPDKAPATPGARIVEDHRGALNKLTPAEREDAFNRGMRLINDVADGNPPEIPDGDGRAPAQVQQWMVEAAKEIDYAYQVSVETGYAEPGEVDMSRIIAKHALPGASISPLPALTSTAPAREARDALREAIEQAVYEMQLKDGVIRESYWKVADRILSVLQPVMENGKRELAYAYKRVRELQALFREENAHAIKLAEAGERLATEFSALRGQPADTEAKATELAGTVDDLQSQLAEKDNGRESLARNLRDGLMARGLFAPDNAADIPGAYAEAIDALRTQLADAVEGRQRALAELFAARELKMKYKTEADTHALRAAEHRATNEKLAEDKKRLSLLLSKDTKHLGVVIEEESPAFRAVIEMEPLIDHCERSTGSHYILSREALDVALDDAAAPTPAKPSAHKGEGI